jgi:hypothetical protein
LRSKLTIIPRKYLLNKSTNLTDNFLRGSHDSERKLEVYS